MIFFLHLFSMLPLTLRIVIGRGCARLFSLFPTRDKKIASAQMRLFLQSPDGDRHLPGVYANLGQTFAESINLKPVLENIDRYVECGDWPLINGILSRKSPIVALTAHTSNWDLLAAFFIKKGIPLTVVGREARNKKLHDFLQQIRTSYGVKTIWRADKSGIKEIVAALRERGIVSALIDQDTDVSSSFVPFFGAPAKTPSGLAALAKKTGAVVACAFMFRTGFCRYRVFVHEIPSDGSVEDILAEYSRLLEQYIRRFPEQWVWIHKRWRSSENGERLSSRKYLAHLEDMLSNRAGGDAELKIAANDTHNPG